MDKKIKIMLYSSVLILVMVIILSFFFNYGYLSIKSIPNLTKIKINNNIYKSTDKIKIRPGKYDVEIYADNYSTYVFKNIEIKLFKKTNLERKLITEREEKFQNTLPYDDGLTFNIELRDTSTEYIYDIGLYAILNREDQIASYNNQIKELKKEALLYIRGFGIDPNNIKINWLQDEAKN